MTTETATYNSLESAINPKAKAPAKKTAKKAVPAKAAAKKGAKKAPAKKAAAKTSTDKESKFGKVAHRVLHCLGTSKTVLYPKTSDKGELTYAAIAEEAEMAINGLTAVLAKESSKGLKFPNSLGSLGLVECNKYEYTDENGNVKNTSMLYKITDKGRAKLKELGSPA